MNKYLVNLISGFTMTIIGISIWIASTLRLLADMWMGIGIGVTALGVTWIAMIITWLSFITQRDTKKNLAVIENEIKKLAGEVERLRKKLK